MKKKPSSYITEVIPLVPLSPRKPPFFSYRAERDIPRGSVVIVPFGPRIVRGVVWKSTRETKKVASSSAPFRYKNITEIIATAFLSEQQLGLAEYFTHVSPQSLGTVLDHFLPKTFIEKIGTLPEEVSRENRGKIPLIKTEKKYFLAQEHKQVVKNILASPHPHTLLFGPSACGKTFVYFELIRKSLKKNAHVLVLVPDQALLLQEEARYARVFGKNAVATFHPGMNKEARDRIFHRLKNNGVRILLGTRSALFLPFQKLALVITDDAGADSYRKKGVAFSSKTEEAAQKLAELHGARSLLGSSTPSFETLFSAQKSESLITLPSPSHRSVSWHTINLRLERWKKKLTPISEELGNALVATVARKEQALLFVSREGMNSFSVCTECKSVFRCPTCKKPISYRKEGDYHCARCNINSGATPACPACGSLSFRHLGAGTERVERDLARRFPKIRTVRYDRKNATKKETLSKLQLFLRGEKDVLITTERGIRGWDLPHLSLIGIIDADTLLGIPSWDADEVAFRNMLSAAGRAGRGVSEEKLPGSIFVQTFHPENPIFSWLAAEDIEGFFRTLEDERTTFLYPPFGDITRLVCRIPNEKKLNQEIDRVFMLLEELAQKSTQKIRVSPPSAPDVTHKNRDLKRHIIIRIATTPEKTASLEDFFKTLPREWTVEHGFS